MIAGDSVAEILAERRSVQTQQEQRPLVRGKDEGKPLPALRGLQDRPAHDNQMECGEDRRQYERQAIVARGTLLDQQSTPAGSIGPLATGDEGPDPIDRGANEEANEGVHQRPRP